MDVGPECERCSRMRGLQTVVLATADDDLPVHPQRQVLPCPSDQYLQSWWIHAPHLDYYHRQAMYPTPVLGFPAQLRSLAGFNTYADDGATLQGCFWPS